MRRGQKVALAALVVVVVVGVVAALLVGGHKAKPTSSHGGSSTTSPSVTSATSSTSAPTTTTTRATTTSSPASSTTTTAGSSGVELSYWDLPRPARFRGVVGVGYPHTRMGAVSMGFGALTAEIQVDPDIAASVLTAVALKPSAALGAQAAAGIRSLRSRYGIAADGPTSDTIGLSVIGCRLSSSSADKVEAGYEALLNVEGPGIENQSTDWSGALAMVWNGHDWRVDTTANLPNPPIAFPGSPGSAAEGWHPCGQH